MSNKPKLGADQSAKTLDGTKSPKKATDMLGGANKLQKDLSVATLASKATVDTMEGSLIAPPFKFGTQKQYRVLQEMDSRQKERKKAETILRDGSPPKKFTNEESKTTMEKSKK